MLEHRWTFENLPFPSFPFSFFCLSTTESFDLIQNEDKSFSDKLVFSTIELTKKLNTS